MKASLVRSLFAVIELVAVLLIIVSLVGPMIWKGTHSDLKDILAHGGDAALTQYTLAVEQTSQSVTQWGVVCGGTILLAALLGSILSRKPREPRD